MGAEVEEVEEAAVVAEVEVEVEGVAEAAVAAEVAAVGRPGSST